MMIAVNRGTNCTRTQRQTKVAERRRNVQPCAHACLGRGPRGGPSAVQGK